MNSTRYRIVPALLAVAMVINVFAPALVARADDATSTSATPGDSGGSGGDGSATVQTGDATSTTDTENTVNYDDTSASPPADATTTVQNSSDATTTATSTTTAGTGDNSASGSSAAVDTGNAFAASNVINVLNTNITNSLGFLAFLNLILGGGFDLNQFDLSYFFGGGNSGDCTLDSCGGSLNVGNGSNADVANDMTVGATTGDNSATSTTGVSIVRTGNAYAAGNLLNVVNTNITNSHYLLLALNNFGDLNGDITLPDADFFQQLFSQSLGLGASTTVSNDNNANITGTTTTNADTGSNAASSTEGQANVTTGTAQSYSGTYNQANTNIVGGHTVYILLNIFGDWTGQVEGLPAGLTWTPTPTGIAITSAGGAPGSLLAGSGSSSLAADASSTATVQNNVHVYALTGLNRALSASSTASIATGNAYAAANVMNIVNTNIIGSNWILAIFNIFGNFHGNISFGHPDLWIGGVAETTQPTPSGGKVTYHFTVSNHGDADAPDVKIYPTFDKGLLTFSASPNDNGAPGTVWSLGDIPRGVTKDFDFDATAATVAPNAYIEVPLTATVTTDATDPDPADNTEHLTIMLGTKPDTGGVGHVEPDPRITLSNTASSPTVNASSSVDFKLSVSDSNGDAYSTMLTDDLVGPDGAVVSHQSWPLGTIQKDETVNVTYTALFGSKLASGTYTNVARLDGMEGEDGPPFGVAMLPTYATSTVDLLPGQVLGASAVAAPEIACTPLLNHYVTVAGPNRDVDVRTLQRFLFDGGDTSVAVTGVYDQATIDAVKRFQSAHAVSILDPWGLTQPTGNVYYTTERVINEMNCNDGSTFTLTPQQVLEIANFRGK